MNSSKALLPLSLAVLGYASFADQQKASAPEIKFGRDVRPILSEHCYKCHGPDVGTLAGGLRLDTFAGATAHGAIVPRDPKGSRLLARVSERDAAMRMPPPNSGTKPLTAAQIATLREWIKQGAKYEQHWAYVPPAMPKVPTVSSHTWSKTLIDPFVLRKLDEAGLKPEPEADRNTLAMRAALTLTGLPPTPTELQSFLADKAKGAYERYVDRLMAKPAYGEHQARYWMDAVRYGDTHGLQLDNERAVFPYRDWVVKAFNKDLPFDKFVKWQLAGDLLPNPTTEQLVATGYVRMNITSNEGGAIAEEFLARNTFDRVDTTSTVMLGLTVACAKCHDHKYDPISQKEYYGLYAFFNSTQDEPLDGNIDLPPPFVPAPTEEQEAKLASISRELRSLSSKVSPVQAAEYFSNTIPPTPTSRNWQISPVYTASSFDEAFDLVKPGEPGQPAAQWKDLPFQLDKDAPDIVRKNNSFVYVRGTLTVPVTRSIQLRISSDDGVRVWLNGTLIHSHKIGRGLTAGPDLVQADFRAGDNEIVAKVVNGISTDGLRIAIGGLSPEIEKLLADYQRSPSNQTLHQRLQEACLASGPDSGEASTYRKLVKERAAIESQVPKTLIAREREKPRPTFILKRGQYDQKGDPVGRHLPAVLGRLSANAAKNRLGLANWMVSPANPLVVRVFVNRMWQQHFGTGIVKTVEDFGSQGEWPQNQDLLDALAVSFVRNGWSIKALNKMIVTSATFRQSSKVTKQKLSKDPENRLMSRGPRFRLDAEVIRDKALDAAGLLVKQVGGKGFKPYQPDGLWEGSSDPASSTHFYVRDKGPTIYRRSLYLYWKRTSPPPVMTTFDAPLRDACVVRRSVTNTPLQALALMNEPAFLEASRVMAVRVITGKKSDDERLRFAYILALGRSPHPDESALLLKSLIRYRSLYSKDPDSAKRLLAVGDSPLAPIDVAEQAAWMLICSSLMNTNEFLTQH